MNTIPSSELDPTKVYKAVGFNAYKEITGIEAWCEKHPTLANIILIVLLTVIVVGCHWAFGNE